MPVELKVPDVGESITEVYIGQWHKSEGEEVEQDEEIVELESEKATFDAPSPASGVLAKILKQTGETAEVGETIAHIESNGKAARAEKKQRREEKKREPEEKKARRQREERAEKEKRNKERERTGEEARQEPGEPAAAEREKPERERPERIETRPRVMPAAQRALAEHELRPEDVRATGPGGRLLKEDVLRHVSARSQAQLGNEAAEREERLQERGAQPGRDEEAVPMTPLRRRIAARLVEAQKGAALLTTFNEIDMTAVMELRARYKNAFQKKYDVKLGFMSFFVKASIDALKQFPQINAEIRGEEIIYKNYYDIGIAIGGGRGLVVPVLRNAERMSFADIELAIGDFAERAQSGDLKPAEMQGGTFTISNGGVYGSLLSTPIVNPPQSGVLGMHAIQDRPAAIDGQVVIRPMMYVALTYDHRIVDGREAVTFLRRIKEAIEEPSRMLIEV